MYSYLVSLCLFLYGLFCKSLTSDNFAFGEDRKDTIKPNDLPVFRSAFINKTFTLTAVRVLAVLLMLGN